MGRFTKLEFSDHEDFNVEPRVEDIGPDIFCLKAEREYQEGHFDNALRFYSRALEMDKLLFEAWRRQVWCLIELQEYKEAALWADKALDLFPDDSELLASKSMAVCRHGRPDEALTIADLAIRQPSCGPYPWIARGEVLLATSSGRYDYCFSKAVCLVGTSWHVFSEIGRACQFHGLHSLAVRYFSRALECEPGIIFVMLETARCQVKIGLTPQAGRTVREVLAMHPGHRDAQTLLTSIESFSVGSGVKGFFLRLFGR